MLNKVQYSCDVYLQYTQGKGTAKIAKCKQERRADISGGNTEKKRECDEGRKLDHRQEVTGEENESGIMRG